jgi:hypothetical protein
MIGRHLKKTFSDYWFEPMLTNVFANVLVLVHYWIAIIYWMCRPQFWYQPIVPYRKIIYFIDIARNNNSNWKRPL